MTHIGGCEWVYDGEGVVNQIDVGILEDLAPINMLKFYWTVIKPKQVPENCWFSLQHIYEGLSFNVNLFMFVK